MHVLRLVKASLASSGSGNKAVTEAGHGWQETVATALSAGELAARLRGVHVLGIRSKTRVGAEALASARRLLCIGCFCIGTNQVDLQARRPRGRAGPGRCLRGGASRCRVHAATWWPASPLAEAAATCSLRTNGAPT